jgi:hypothetical protein
MRIAIAMTVVGLAGCPRARIHPTTNAPGNVVLAPPAFENGQASFIAASDPGEREIYIGPGIVGGPASGREPDDSDTGVELGAYVRLAYSEREFSHHQDEVPWPMPGWALSLGWSPLQYKHHYATGPVYAEVERQWLMFSVGLGVAAYPDTGATGGQLTVAAMPIGLRDPRRVSTRISDVDHLVALIDRVTLRL